MKKILFVMVLAFAAIVLNAQTIENCNADFPKFLKGEKSNWKIINWTKPKGDIVIKDGVVSITSKGAVYTGVFYEKMIPAKAPLKLKFTITASGKGAVRFGFWEYAGKGMVYTDNSAGGVLLTEEMKEYTIMTSFSPKAEKLRPFIYIRKNVSIQVKDFKVEVVK